eukprot:gene25706-27955_t
MQSVGFVCAAYASRLHELRRTGHLTDRRNDRVSIPSEAFVEGELAQIHHAILRQAPAEGIRRQVAASVPGIRLSEAAIGHLDVDVAAVHAEALVHDLHDDISVDGRGAHPEAQAAAAGAVAVGRHAE